jgi:ATP-dependent RNA helicase DDX27
VSVSPCHCACSSVISHAQFDEAEAERRKAAFFSQDPTSGEPLVSFPQLNLSRPLMKAITTMGYAEPTAIQARTIPLALMGRDICACAATGSGKTAAFMLPILERLLFRPKQIAKVCV